MGFTNLGDHVGRPSIRSRTRSAVRRNRLFLQFQTGGTLRTAALAPNVD
ncbi:hypothetical protein G3I60_24245 [Streptomyces sp. SID13666]|nr:hypothetical protein [Streptomyces sp. SID13666]NEA57173.1 hypothetical protein [Streptomyces sp. SID13666]